ncbi:ANFC protein, partial [Trogon melanurus]|nr:ANFC protein [Trogon melanurus]
LKLLFCPGFLLLLIASQNQAGARPIPSLQSLAKLWEEDLEHPLVSEERDHNQDDMIPTGGLDQQDAEFQWTQNAREQPEGTPVDEGAVQRFLSDLLSSPRRYRARSKKGLPRGCFGVRLDRIGSLSGLGC